MNNRECAIKDCPKPVKELGMCSMHAARMRRHGDPGFVIHQKDRNLPRGDKHHAWTGAAPTYEVAHRRVKKARGAASTHECADCGKRARHWSYDHADPSERISDDGRPYSTDVAHYVPRCVSCHKAFDCEFLLAERGTLSGIPRCGKPIRAAKVLARIPEGDPVPVCGRPEAHTGWCTSQEVYKRSTRRPKAPAAPAMPKPRCSHVLQPGHGDSTMCGRPAGHNGSHVGTEAYRRQLANNAAREKRLRPPVLVVAA